VYNIIKKSVAMCGCGTWSLTEEIDILNTWVRISLRGEFWRITDK
jgi:hypothetical protein